MKQTIKQIMTTLGDMNAQRTHQTMGFPSERRIAIKEGRGGSSSTKSGQRVSGRSKLPSLPGC